MLVSKGILFSGLFTGVLFSTFPSLAMENTKKHIQKEIESQEVISLQDELTRVLGSEAKFVQEERNLQGKQNALVDRKPAIVGDATEYPK